MEKVVLAYSGGLDTSVSVRWIQEKYGLEVVTLTIDLGQERELDGVRERALKSGAIEARLIDAKATFVEHFIWPGLQAGAVYEDSYYLATALGRPLIAWLLVDTAHEVGATAVAHGSTGKGNDQVRFDVSVATLDPELRVIAPVREWKMTRDAELEYAEKHGIEVPVTKESPYSVDENLWAVASKPVPSKTPGRSQRATCSNGPSIRAKPPMIRPTWTSSSKAGYRSLSMRKSSTGSN